MVSGKINSKIDRKSNVLLETNIILHILKKENKQKLPYTFNHFT